MGGGGGVGLHVTFKDTLKQAKLAFEKKLNEEQRVVWMQYCKEIFYIDSFEELDEFVVLLSSSSLSRNATPQKVDDRFWWNLLNVFSEHLFIYNLLTRSLHVNCLYKLIIWLFRNSRFKNTLKQVKMAFEMKENCLLYVCAFVSVVSNQEGVPSQRLSHVWRRKTKASQIKTS